MYYIYTLYIYIYIYISHKSPSSPSSLLEPSPIRPQIIRRGKPPHLRNLAENFSPWCAAVEFVPRSRLFKRWLWLCHRFQHIIQIAIKIVAIFDQSDHIWSIFSGGRDDKPMTWTRKGVPLDLAPRAPQEMPRDAAMVHPFGTGTDRGIPVSGGGFGGPKKKLVGGFNHLEKIWKSMGRIIPYIMENKKCLKPPTRRGCDDVSMVGMWHRTWLWTDPGNTWLVRLWWFCFCMSLFFLAWLRHWQSRTPICWHQVPHQPLTTSEYHLVYQALRSGLQVWARRGKFPQLLAYIPAMFTGYSQYNRD